MANDRRWRPPGPDSGVWVVLAWVVVVLFAAAILALIILTATGAQN